MVAIRVQPAVRFVMPFTIRLLHLPDTPRRFTCDSLTYLLMIANAGPRCRSKPAVRAYHGSGWDATQFRSNNLDLESDVPS
jgi:hypothetical protein